MTQGHSPTENKTGAGELQLAGASHLADGRYGERKVLQYAGIVMDLATLRTTRGGRNVKLGPTEFRLLRLLLEHPERAFTREQMKAGAWGRGVKLDSRSISTCLGRLRRALNAPGEPNVIRTIIGHGYSLDASCSNVR